MIQQCQQQENQSLREIMASTQLPVLPPNTPYLLKAMASEDLGFAELAAVVEKFPSIAARLISLANSPWSSPVVEVTSVEMACARLGFFVVRSVSVALGIANVFNPSLCPAFDPVRYWTRAFLMAEVATTLAERVADRFELEPQSVRTAGLLHNLGLLWLATCLPDETQQALLAARDDPQPDLDRLLEQSCGVGFVEAGAMLAESWDFPALLVQSLRHQDEPDYDQSNWPAAALLGVGRCLIHRSNLEAPAEEPIDDPRWQRLGFSSQDQEELLRQIEAHRDNVRELASTLFAT